MMWHFRSAPAHEVLLVAVDGVEQQSLVGLRNDAVLVSVLQAQTHCAVWTLAREPERQLVGKSTQAAACDFAEMLPSWCTFIPTCWMRPADLATAACLHQTTFVLPLCLH